ncbi:hypothetical protein GA0115252_12543 [Streptomyces sp. DfronAA-171]|nr:hypothetical protein GA0115252_12543 [Streptomyces sp. DfronAA-171]
MSRPKAAPLLLGVRHHGPGSARAVRAALDAARPAVVLIEGPPEADALVPLAADPGLRPPVALLAHLVDEPARSAFWPFAAFSPEWTALRWAAAYEVPVRFIDLPAANSLAMRDEEEREPADGEGDGDGQEVREDDTPAQDAGRPGDAGSGDADGDAAPAAVRIDPVAVLAETAGYDDPERWWEDVVEHRSGPAGEGAEGEGAAESPYPFGAFAALAEAMTALRERYADGGHPQDAVREAHMRLCLRAAEKEFGPEAVAVVCGAWHVPALATRVPLATDRAALRGLPKAKTALTWVPWTHRRLARASGYGAGIESPGWYGHLFAAPDRPVERWLTKVAGLLREEDKHVSSAHVIEAVRLAETLAVMRGRPLAGLGETMDAVRSVMCEGSDVPLALVHDRLVVGDVLGEVPDSAPAMPLQRDLTRLQRALRLKPEALERTLELDLRKDNDVARSGLLHRLRLLGVDWGVPAASHGSTGTFRETWTLRWDPELAVRVAEAGIWGTTVLGAAEARASARAAEAKRLGEITALVEACLPAALSESLPHVMRALADLAALDTDVARLAEALPALVRTLRYGDVRGTDTGALTEVAAGLAERVFVGLPRPARAWTRRARRRSASTWTRCTARSVSSRTPWSPGRRGPGHRSPVLRRGVRRPVTRRARAPGRAPGRARGRALPPRSSRTTACGGAGTGCSGGSPGGTRRPGWCGGGARGCCSTWASGSRRRRRGSWGSRSRRGRPRPRRRRGSTVSSAAARRAAACCSCTTSGCSGSWTSGSYGSPRPRSRMCCRCCGARSPRTNRPCAARSASW